MHFCDEYDKIARYYDDLIDEMDDLPLYLHYARECGSPVLELGVGTGRMIIELAKNGYETVGIDGSPEMLSIAQAKLDVLPDVKRIASLVQGDLPSVLYDRDVIRQQFAIVIVPCNLFHEFLSADERARLLEGIYTCLKPDGVVVIDLFCPEVMSPEGIGSMAYYDRKGQYTADLQCSTDEISREFVYHTGTSDVATMRFKLDAIHCYNSNSIISVFRRIYYDRHNKLSSLVYIFDEIKPDGGIISNVAQFQHILLSKNEVENCLIDAGFMGIKVYSSFDFQEWTDRSSQMVFVARKEK